GTNPSADRRIGFAIRYIPTRIRQTGGPRDSATLVRGTDAFGHFELEPRPDADLDAAMLALHAEISDRQAKILYRGTTRTRLLASAFGDVDAKTSALRLDHAAGVSLLWLVSSASRSR